MKNETKKNDQAVIKQKLPTRNTRQQKEPQSINSNARRWTTVTTYEQLELRLGDTHLQLDWI